VHVMGLFEQDRAGLINAGRIIAKEIAREQGTVTIDDVRERLGVLPVTVDLRALGAVFKEPGWECVGYKKSKRRECHHRPIGVWRWKGDGAGKQNRGRSAWM